MAHSAVETQKVSSFRNREYNLTSLSIFDACLLASAFALPIWGAIAFLLTR